MRDIDKLAEEIEKDGTEMDQFLVHSDHARIVAAALRLAESCQQFVDEEGNVWQDFDSEAFEAYLKELES